MRRIICFIVLLLMLFNVNAIQAGVMILGRGAQEEAGDWSITFSYGQDGYVFAFENAGPTTPATWWDTFTTKYAGTADRWRAGSPFSSTSEELGLYATSSSLPSSRLFYESVGAFTGGLAESFDFGTPQSLSASTEYAIAWTHREAGLSRGSEAVWQYDEAQAAAMPSGAMTNDGSYNAGICVSIEVETTQDDYAGTEGILGTYCQYSTESVGGANNVYLCVYDVGEYKAGAVDKVITWSRDSNTDFNFAIYTIDGTTATRVVDGTGTGGGSTGTIEVSLDSEYTLDGTLKYGIAMNCDWYTSTYKRYRDEGTDNTMYVFTETYSGSSLPATLDLSAPDSTQSNTGGNWYATK